MTTFGYGCTFDECQRPVTWLITNLSNGAVISLCDEDLSVGLVPVMAANLGVDTGKLYEAVKRLVDREAAKAAKARTPEDQARDAARKEHGDNCPECGVAWDQPSPECPHEVWNLHPLPEPATT